MGRVSRDDYSEALLNEEAGEVTEEAPSKPLQPLAGVIGYDGHNYDHIYNTFPLQEDHAAPHRNHRMCRILYRFHGNYFLKSSKLLT